MMYSDDALTKLKTQRNLFFGIAALTAFMGTMKAIGIFAIGFFPFWVEIGLSFASLIYGIVFAIKVQKFEQAPK